MISPCFHMIHVDTSFCPNYHGSSTPKKKKLIAKRRKVAQDDFQGRFLPFNFELSFDLLNVII